MSSPARRDRSRVVAVALALLATGTADAGSPDGAASAPNGPAADDTGPALLEDGGHLELGIGLRAEQSVREPLDADADIEITAALDVFIAGEWRHGRAFFDGRWGSIDGASVGLTAFANDTRTFDVLVAHLAPTTNVAYGREDDAETAATERDEALVERDTAFGSSGLRWREYRGDVLYQLSAVVDWEHDNGVLASAQVGRQWQLGNWHAESAIGLRWASDALTDFLYGVDADEATERFAVHEADAGTFVDLELALSRPLARNWVLRTQARVRVVDDAILDSPLVARRAGVGLDTAISYVF